MKSLKQADALLLMVLISLLGIGGSGCSNKETVSTPGPVVHRWTIVKRTAAFPTNTALNFTEISSSSDYMDFRSNDTVYSYLSLYLPFGTDTASYIISSNTITVHDTRQYGIIFQNQDSNGNILQTTDIEILSVTDSTMRLRFPAMGSVVAGGNTTYYPGTITYDLKR